MRRFTSRRGLGTVVTTALMLTAVAILGSTIVAWSNGNLKVYETNLSNTATTNTNKINENLVIENVAFCINCGATSKNVINATITNIGTIPVQVTQIQVNSTAITSYYYKIASASSPSCPPPSGLSTCLPATILPNKSYLVSAAIPSSKTWASAKPDTITVTTARGSTYTIQAVPP